METIDNHILKFIKKHHLLTLATSHENVPYCAHCFYAYSEELNAFIFSSDKHTKHISSALQNNTVACAIGLETNVVGKIQGIQVTGKLMEANSERYPDAKKTYMKRFPYAQLMKTTLWVLEIEFIKMTDNKLGFGKKIIWNKTEKKA